MMTPSQVWAGFDPQSENLNSILISEGGNKKTYTFLAMTASDGEVVAEMNVFSPTSPTKKTVLLVGEYYQLPQKDLIDDLVSKNYLVCYVDYSAVGRNTATSFPVFKLWRYSKRWRAFNKALPHGKGYLPIPLFCYNQKSHYLYPKGA